ncbi:MAG: c-type cytochrome [Saprospiraceae bacterium]
MDWLLLSFALLFFIILWYCNGLFSKIVSSIRSDHSQTFISWGGNYFLLKIGMILISLVLVGLMAYMLWDYKQQEKASILFTKNIIRSAYDTTKVWQAPDLQYLNEDKNKDLILYGRQLIANTSEYLGPKGIIKHMSNGMNCQNCHLDAGTKPFGNNYSAVSATYPRFRARSGTEETIAKRINDCIQRSLNGDSLLPQSKEMKAITAYIQWIGQAVPKNKMPLGVGLYKIKLLKRAADPLQGQFVYAQKCMTCHGPTGQGLPKPENKIESYPPLWGDHSYNEGAGLYRLSSFAGFVKANMPFGADSENPQLTDEEAWDVAAFVNSQPRPKHKFLNIDWPVISKKPYDHPFGPFVDSFPEYQHKYGPYQPIVEWQNKKSK